YNKDKCFEGLTYNKKKKNCDSAFFAPATYQNILDNGNIKALLRIIADAEGNIYLNARKDPRESVKYKIDKKIGLSATHPTLNKEIQEMLDKLDIKHSLEPNKKCPNIIIIPPKEFEEFQEKIGFTRGVKVSKKSPKWVGKNKTDILDVSNIFTKMALDRSIYPSNFFNLNKTLYDAVSLYEKIADEEGIEAARRGVGKYLCDTQETGHELVEKCKIFVDSGFKKIDERIFSLLREEGPVTASHISNTLKVELSTIHKHLRELRNDQKIKVVKKIGTTKYWGIL
ncbi:MAG: winged helix-turn-helix domain-containing protein, partial [Promethearchaeota archaeon]